MLATGAGIGAVLDQEWAEVAEEIGRRFDDWHRGIGDPTAVVPLALAGPAHVSRAPMADEVCEECGWEVGHAWTCSRGGNT